MANNTTHIVSDTHIHTTHSHCKKLVKNLLCGEKIFTVENFLTKKECQDIIDTAEKKGFNESSLSGGGHGRTGREDARTSQVCVYDDEKMANIMWLKIQNHLPPDVSHVSNTGYLSNDRIAKEWNPVGVNPHIRIYKYKVGQVFPEHIDYKMYRKIMKNKKEYRQLTFMTLLIYLNDDYSGGNTGFWTQHDKPGVKEHCRFLRSSENKPHQIVINPKVGRALVNDQNLLHEGMTPTKGIKYVLRTDIVHERNFPIHEKVLKTMSEKDLADQEGSWERLFETSCKNYAD